MKKLELPVSAKSRKRNNAPHYPASTALTKQVLAVLKEQLGRKLPEWLSDDLAYAIDYIYDDVGSSDSTGMPAGRTPVQRVTAYDA